MSETSQGGSAQFCGQCGAPLLPDAKFCATCGAPVQESATSAAGKITATTHPATAPEAKRSSRTMWLAGVAVVALIVILALSFVLNQQQQQPAAAVATVPAAQPQQDIPYPDVVRVSPADAHAAVISGQAIIVDVRDLDSYNQEHVAGAISMPLAELPAHYTELPKDQQIILYCTWPAEESSARAAQYLLEQGYSDVAAIQGGLESWMAAGLPAEGA